MGRIQEVKKWKVNRGYKMKKYMSISKPSHDRLIEFINKYYACCGWRIISIVKGNGDFWATLECEKNDKKRIY